MDYDNLSKEELVDEIKKLNEKLDSAKEIKDTVDALNTRLEDVKWMESALRQNTAKFKNLVSNIPGAVYQSANDDIWTLFYLSENFELITGYPTTDFVKLQIRSLKSIIVQADLARVEDAKKAALEKRDPFRIEYRIINSKGEHTWVTENGQGIFGDNGEIYWIDGVIFDISEQKQVEQHRIKLIQELQDAMGRIKVLSGLLPICSSCKKIRDDEGYWHTLETYISKYSEAEFSHSVCKDCAKKLYPDMNLEE